MPGKHQRAKVVPDAMNWSGHKKSPDFRAKSGLLGLCFRRLETVKDLLLAEQAGFEPAVGFTPRTLSRRVT